MCFLLGCIDSSATGEGGVVRSDRLNPSPSSSLHPPPSLPQTNRLTVSLIQYISSVDPAAYSDQQKQDSQGVKNVGQFISELGKLSPRTLAAQMALLLPHLGGDSYTIRSEIVTAIGHILERLFPRREGQAEVADAQQAEAR